ncbi:oligosaccharide flippase family protein [Roseobacter ponti]|uniref:Oligosaccharide flippase family protein n=1 Tax=Roseobacter ponti TaxID=1891787 RepID=A0A858SNN6_9RHOB|nr:oligosaccharide flippase family protein [Roseobacter ponti]QJF50285.1 oligosaccharide flippase family protein [Roseobacter ponti]
MTMRPTLQLPVPGFFRDLGIMSVVRLSGGFLLFATQVMLARWMSTDDFGIFSFAWMWVAILSTVAGFGYVAASVRFLARYNDQHMAGMAHGIIRHSRQVVLISAGVVSLIAWAAFELLLENSPYLPGLRIALFAVPVLTLLNIDSAVARAMGWMGMSTIAEQIGRPLVLLAAGAVLAHLYGVTTSGTYIAACLAAYLIVTSVQNVVVRRRIARALPEVPPLYERRRWNSVAFLLFWLSLSQMLRINGDGIVVGLVLGTEQVALYVTAVRTATLAGFVLVITNMVSQPRLSALMGRKDDEELRRFYRTARLATLAAVIAIALALSVLGKPVLGLFGPQYVAAYPALLILLGGHVVAAYFGPAMSLLTMGDEQKAVALISTAGAILNILLTLFLASHYGIAGAACSSAGTAVLTAFLMARIAERRIL